MPNNKKTDAAAAAAPTTTKGSASMSTPAGSLASIWLATKASGQKLVASPSGFKFIFEDEMLLHLMLLNA
ncbi:hypothetical protein KCU65_g9683, partial [Aureobasidium melanogenum]